MTLRYPRNDMVFWGFQGHRLGLKLRLGLGLGLRLRQQQYGVGSNFMSAFISTLKYQLLDSFHQPHPNQPLRWFISLANVSSSSFLALSVSSSLTSSLKAYNS